MVAVEQPVVEQAPAGIPHLQNYEQYTAKYLQLQAAIESCDLEQVRALFSELGIKYAPYTSAANQQMYIHGLMDLNEQEYYWPIFSSLCRSGVAPAERKIELLEYLKTNGFNLRQALCQVRQPGKVSFKDNQEQPINLAVPLLVALHYQQWDLATYLWTHEDFVNIYEPTNLQNLAHQFNNIYNYNYASFEVIASQLLSSATSVNLFLRWSVKERQQFVDSLLYVDYSRVLAVLAANRHYAPYVLPLLINRDTYMRSEDFTVFDHAVENSTVVEIEQLGQATDYDDKFLAFFRYVDILDLSDPKKQHGQKLVELVKNTQKFKAYLDQTLRVLDNDSVIQEEEADEGVGEGGRGPSARLVNQSHQIHSNQAKLAGREEKTIRDFTMEQLHQAIANNREEEAIEILKTHKFSDLQFMRGPAESFMNVLRLGEDQRSWVVASGDIANSFNILQVAIERNLPRLAEYILTQHKFYHHQLRVLRNLDPRFVLHNPDADDETQTVRFAIESQNSFQLIWERFGDLFTIQQTLTVLRYIVDARKDFYLPAFLQSNSSQQAFLNMSTSQRVEFLELCSDQYVQNSSYYPDVYNLLQSHPYNLFEESYRRDVVA